MNEWHCDHEDWKEEGRYRVWASNRSEEACPPSVPITVVEKCRLCGVERHRYEAPAGVCLILMETGHSFAEADYAALGAEAAALVKIAKNNGVPMFISHKNRPV